MRTPFRATLLSLCALSTICAPANAADPDDCCSPETRKSMLSGNPGREEVARVQRCLIAHKLYASDPAEDDGIVGEYTRAALNRCPAPVPLALPVQDCGDGNQMVVWALTSADIKKLQEQQKQVQLELKQKKEQQKDLEQDPNTPPLPTRRPPDTSRDRQPISDDFLKRLLPMQNATYPSRQMFENAFDYFTSQPPPNSSSENDLLYRPDIVSGACKPLNSGNTAEKWLARSDGPMLVPLSQPTYGFYPDSLKADAAPGNDPPTAKIDFSLLERIGWFGVTFNGAGALTVPGSMEPGNSGVTKQIELARRYRASVDLVVYRNQSREQWLELINGQSADPQQLSPAPFTAQLTTNIADRVGKPLTRFLDKVQGKLLLNELTSAPTAWDGVTLYFEGYPFDDDRAMRFLVDFLRALRAKLRRKEIWATFAKRSNHDLALNIVVPYERFAANESPNITVSYLAGLVPRAKGESSTYHAGSEADDVVDHFIVFLPEPTSDNKKTLRLAVEAAFNRNMAIKASLQKDQSESIGIWRFQMLRKIIYVLSPGTWAWKGDYTKPGMQFYDDMVYANDNFRGVGFWPLPEYSDDNAVLAGDVRSVFRKETHGSFQEFVVPAILKVVPISMANWVGAYRRELIIFVVEPIALLLFLYFALAFWLFELRQFCRSHPLWFIGPFLLSVAIVVLLCLFDRELSSYAITVFFVLVLLSAALFASRRYFLSAVEKDLP